MSAMSLTAGLRAEYEQLFASCRIRPERELAVDQLAERVVAGRHRYAAVTAATGVPWFVVAALHALEAGLRFDRHLHNGDPLRDRTRRVPAGRPRRGAPPFTWEESAIDALTLQYLPRARDWSVGATLYRLERYNGWGYRRFHADVPSPYLWSFSTYYDRGKYVADGRWSASARSAQCGAAVLLRRLAERGEIAFATGVTFAAEPLVSRYARTRPRHADLARRAEELQAWLDTFPAVYVRVDGIPGPRTSAAYRTVTGAYLPGDPRATASPSPRRRPA